MAEYHGPKEEFNALRREMEQTRQYVFERPLLIISASLAAIALFDKPFVLWLIPLAVGLLTVNLWFTAERMRSLSRIVAYIQLVLEQKTYEPWLGWETSLCYFRTLMGKKSQSIRCRDRLWPSKEHWCELWGFIKCTKVEEPIPEAAGYYPTMWLMHLVSVVVLFVVSVVLLVPEVGFTEAMAAVLTLLLMYPFLVVAVKDNPRKLGKCISETAGIWLEVFEKLVEQENKTGNDTQAKEDPCSPNISA
jgi:hypothetical protein